MRGGVRAVLALGCGLFWAGAALAGSPLKVVVTIKPVHALVAGVMQGVAMPELLVKGASSPHDYALKPSDARQLNHADIFFRVSESLEPFTARIAQALPKSVEIVTLVETPGLMLLPMRTSATFEGHAGPGHEHSHHHADAGGEAVDAHIWLDPENAVVLIDRIEAALSARSPGHAAAFKANAASLKQKIVALDRELGDALGPVASRPYIVFHDAFQYFESRYRLSVAGSIAVSPESSPSGRRLTELRQKVRSLRAACVFGEPQFDRRLVDTVIEGTSARTGTLDPEGSGLEPGPDLYFVLMRRLVDDLRGCLLAPT